MITHARQTATLSPRNVMALICSGRCLIFSAILLATIAVPRMEAQQCYIKTNEHAWGNFFVKAVSDSTCFGQFYDTLRYQNYKTREIYYKFSSKEYRAIPNVGIPWITDILRYDSIIVVSWENGQVIRFLKISRSSRISELPSVLDSMPLVKFGDLPHNFYDRKIRKVNDSIVVISNSQRLFSFIISVDTITCVDSLLICDPSRGGDLFDVKGDTLVILAINEQRALFFSITKNGHFKETEVQRVDRKYDMANATYGHGNIYFTDDGLNALIRTDTGFVYKRGRYYNLPHGPMILPHAMALIDETNRDQLDIYTPDIDTLCIKPQTTMRNVLSASNWGDKILIARSDGITTWIPDTTIVSTVDALSDPPLPDVEIWPNPSTSGSFNVSCDAEISSITVTSMLGRIVYSNRGTLGKTVIVESPELKPGMYFITVQSGRNVIRKRVTVLLD